MALKSTYETTRDEVLWQGCLEDDRYLQRCTYDKYKNFMFTLAYRITNDRHLAADVLQESFLLVFRNIKSYRGEGSFGGWIRTILVRTAVKACRTKFRFEELGEDPPYLASERSDETLSHLEHVLQSLPIGYRTVFTLIEIEGYKHWEVADLLGISTSTSKSQLRKAKIRLRELLSDEYSR